MKAVIIGGSGLIGSKIVTRIPPVLLQPMAADDVANAVCRVAVGPPLQGLVEVAGPQLRRAHQTRSQGAPRRP